MIGTSSWNYPGWVGQVYVGDYSGARKDFVKARFEEQSLHDYGVALPTVCFDGAYWRFPTTEQLEKFRDAVPADFKFALKVTDQITVRRFRNDARSGVMAGKLNPGYLDARLFLEHFLAPVRESLGEKLGPIILEFSPFFFGKKFGDHDGYTPLEFVKDLHKFLDQIRPDFKLAIEVRDPVLIEPPFTRYLDCLNYHGVAHVLNEQTWMPELHAQMELPMIETADFSVVRALTRPGVTHEKAVKQYAPYEKTQEPLPELREALAKLANESLSRERGLYIYINNRAEGNAPNTIAAVLALMATLDSSS